MKAWVGGVRLVLACFMTAGCGASELSTVDSRLPDRNALYVLVTANQELCEEIAEECGRRWVPISSRLGAGHCKDFLGVDAWPMRIRAQAGLVVILQVESKAELSSEPTQDLTLRLAELVAVHQQTCELPLAESMQFGDLNSGIRRLRNRFRSLQRAILTANPLNDLQIEKLYDQWEPRIAEAEASLYSHRARVHARNRAEEEAAWRRFVEGQENRQKELVERQKRLRYRQAEEAAPEEFNR